MIFVGFEIKSSMGTESVYTQYMKYLFEVTSYTPFPNEIDVPNTYWDEYIDMLYKAFGYDKPKKNYLNNIPDTKIDNPRDGVVVGFSSGKDSAAAALALRDLGVKDVVLCHIGGLNRSYYSETAVAKEFAEKLGFEIIVNRLKYVGISNAVDPVVKNHLILAYIITYMINEGFTRCSLGEYPVFTLDNLCLTYQASDAIDLIKAFEKAIQGNFPQFRFEILFKSQTHSYAYLYAFHQNDLQYTQSCLTPDRFRGVRVKSLNDKWGIADVKPHTCLYCYKCCHGYLFESLWNGTPIDSKFFKGHILSYLRDGIPKVINVSQDEVNRYSVKDIIDRYIDMKDLNRYKSNTYEIMKDITFERNL